MKEIVLSPRLACVAGFVERGNVIADVGTDHGYLPIRLLQSGVSPRAVAADVRPGPLESARANAAAAGVSDRLTLYLCDGLALCPPDAVDAVVMAGMGGETMMKILDAAPWAFEKRLILQPQTKVPELRRWLCARGLAVLNAALARDAGRIYLVWRLGRGAMDADAVIDRVLLEKRDPLLPGYLAELAGRARKQLNGIESAHAPNPAEAERLRGELAALERIRTEAEQWQGLGKF